MTRWWWVAAVWLLASVVVAAWFRAAARLNRAADDAAYRNLLAAPCESCGDWFSVANLIDGRCAECTHGPIYELEPWEGN